MRGHQQVLAGPSALAPEPLAETISVAWQGLAIMQNGSLNAAVAAHPNQTQARHVILAAQLTLSKMAESM